MAGNKPVKRKKKVSNDDVSSLQQSDFPYNENIPSIKIPMDMMEQEPFLSDKASDSEYLQHRRKLLLAPA